MVTRGSLEIDQNLVFFLRYPEQTLTASPDDLKSPRWLKEGAEQGFPFAGWREPPSPRLDENRGASAG
jgi:hypothetical protein